MKDKFLLWRIYQIAKTTGSRPSSLLEIHDPWTAIQLDSAVCLVGSTIESALKETVEVETGDKKSFKQKYTLSQLIDPDFRFEDESRTILADEMFSGVDGIMFDTVR